VSQFGYFQDEWAMVLVTEYATGDVFDLMTDHFNTPQYSQSLRLYAAEVLLGLEWMHQRGLLYRDLKPENLLVKTSSSFFFTSGRVANDTHTSVKVGVLGLGPGPGPVRSCAVLR
jgi:serine/threonine protein kinase